MEQKEMDFQEVSSGPPASLDALIKYIDPSEGYSIVLRKWVDGTRTQVKTYNSEEVDLAKYDTVAKEFGCGKYQYTFHWSEENEEGKVVNRNKSSTIDLGGPYYEQLHEDYMDDKADEQRKKQERRRVRNGDSVDNTQQVDPTALAEAQISLGLKIAEALKPAPVPETKDTSTDNMIMLMKMQQAQTEASNQRFQAMLLGAIGLATPIIQGLMNRPPKEEPNPMASFKEMMGMAKQMIEVKALAEPTEKETAGEKLVDMVAQNLPAVLAVVTQRAEERQKSMMYRLAKSSPEMQMIESDKAMQERTTERFVEKFGVNQAYLIVKGLDWDDMATQLEPHVSQETDDVDDEDVGGTPPPTTPQDTEVVHSVDVEEEVAVDS